MAHALATNPEHEAGTSQSDPELLLVSRLSQEIQSAQTIKVGFERIASAFAALGVTVERITLIRDNEQTELTVNDNASGVRRQIDAQIGGLAIKVTYLSPILPSVNASLQTLVTMAAMAAREWTDPVIDASPEIENPRMIGGSPQLRELRLQIRQAARSPHSVLIKGESGTGKTTAALMIHEQGPRANKPFIELNCAAIPEALLESELFGHEKGAFTGAGNVKKGLFETADGGTLFLDEIGELKPELQAKLLTAIEKKKIRRLGGTKDIQCNVRIIAASSSNFEKMIIEKTFRADLFYRLAILEIDVPALRERPSDVPALIQNRLRYEQELIGQSDPFKIEDDALKALSFYDWPGNIRELQNIISRMTARLDNNKPITLNDVHCQLSHTAIEAASLILPQEARVIYENETLYSYVARVQLLAIEAATTAEGSHTRAAVRLGYRRSSLVGLKTKLLCARENKQPDPCNPSHIHLAAAAQS